MQFSDGSVYIGDWKKNKRDGGGIYFGVPANLQIVSPWLLFVKMNNLEYAGSWALNKKHGMGYTCDEECELTFSKYVDDAFVEIREVVLHPLKKCLLWTATEKKAFFDVSIVCVV